MKNKVKFFWLLSVLVVTCALFVWFNHKKSIEVVGSSTRSELLSVVKSYADSTRPGIIIDDQMVASSEMIQEFARKDDSLYIVNTEEFNVFCTYSIGEEKGRIHATLRKHGNSLDIKDFSYFSKTIKGN